MIRVTNFIIYDILLNKINYDTNCNIFPVCFFSFKRKDFYSNYLLDSTNYINWMDSCSNLGSNLPAEFPCR